MAIKARSRSPPRSTIIFGFAASTEAVSNHHFDQLFASYLEDERVRDFMARANPAALRETVARFAEAIRRELWTPRSNRAADLIAELLPEAQGKIEGKSHDRDFNRER